MGAICAGTTAIAYRAAASYSIELPQKWPKKEALQTHSTSACILWEPEDAWRKGERELLFQTLQQNPRSSNHS